MLVPPMWKSTHRYILATNHGFTDEGGIHPLFQPSTRASWRDAVRHHFDVASKGQPHACLALVVEPIAHHHKHWVTIGRSYDGLVEPPHVRVDDIVGVDMLHGVRGQPPVEELAGGLPNVPPLTLLNGRETEPKGVQDG